MSIFCDALNEGLSAALTGAPTEDQWRLATAYIFHPNAEALGSTNVVMAWAPASGAIYSTLYVEGAKYVTCATNYGAGHSAGFPALGPLTSDEWHLIGVLVAPNAGTPLKRVYLDETTGSTTFPATTSSGRAFNSLYIGRAGDDASARWRGFIAEPAVWTVANESHANAIMAELLTKRPDAVSSGSPNWYTPLLSGASGGIGPDPTVLSTPTFHSDVHPALSGPSEGGNAVVLAQLARRNLFNGGFL